MMWLQLLRYCHLQVFSSLITKNNAGKLAVLALYPDKLTCYHVIHWWRIINSPATSYNWTSTVRFSKLLLTQMRKNVQKFSGRMAKIKTDVRGKKKKSLALYLQWSDTISIQVASAGRQEKRGEDTGCSTPLAATHAKGQGRPGLQKS